MHAYFLVGRAVGVCLCRVRRSRPKFGRQWDKLLTNLNFVHYSCIVDYLDNERFKCALPFDNLLSVAVICVEGFNNSLIIIQC